VEGSPSIVVRETRITASGQIAGDALDVRLEDGTNEFLGHPLSQLLHGHLTEFSQRDHIRPNPHIQHRAPIADDAKKHIKKNEPLSCLPIPNTAAVQRNSPAARRKKRPVHRQRFTFGQMTVGAGCWGDSIRWLSYLNTGCREMLDVLFPAIAQRYLRHSVFSIRVSSIGDFYRLPTLAHGCHQANSARRLSGETAQNKEEKQPVSHSP
jgi:hypothetical protein